MRIKGLSTKSVRANALHLQQENKELRSQIRKLEAKISGSERIKTEVKDKIKTRLENLPEKRKLSIGKMYAKSFIDDKIKGGFDTTISDLSGFTLETADFCSDYKISLRQLSVILFASNFNSVRKRDLFQNRDVGQWYFQTIESLFEKELIIQVKASDYSRWVYFTLSPQGERIAKAYKMRMKHKITTNE